MQETSEVTKSILRRNEPTGLAPEKPKRTVRFAKNVAGTALARALHRPCNPPTDEAQDDLINTPDDTAHEIPGPTSTKGSDDEEWEDEDNQEKSSDVESDKLDEVDEEG